MNSLLSSDGNKFLVSYRLGIPFLAISLGLLHCSTSYKPTGESQSYEVGLKEDRQKIEDMRKNIPPEIRQRNDALKEVLDLMGELKVHPSKVRDRFQRLMRKRRNTFQKEMRKERQTYSKNERKRREDFLDSLKKEKDKFRKRKDVTKEDRNDFYDAIDEKRKEFFSNERDKRKDFESSSNERNKDFFAELKSQQQEFNEEWRDYNRRWNEWQKQKRDSKRQQQAVRQQGTSSLSNSSNPVSGQMSSEDQRAFEQMQSQPGESLNSDGQ